MGDCEMFKTRVPEVEFLLLRIVRFDFDLALPQDMLGGLVSSFLEGYAQGPGCNKLKSGTDQLKQFETNLLRTAKSFTNDAFQGVCPLLWPPRAMAAGALTIAMRHLDRSAKVDDIWQCLAAAEPSLQRAEVKSSEDEILNVFRTNREVKLKAQGSAGTSPAKAPSGGSTAAAVGSSPAASGLGAAAASPRPASATRPGGALDCIGPVRAEGGRAAASEVRAHP